MAGMGCFWLAPELGRGSLQRRQLQACVQKAVFGPIPLQRQQRGGVIVEAKAVRGGQMPECPLTGHVWPETEVQGTFCLRSQQRGLVKAIGKLPFFACGCHHGSQHAADEVQLSGLCLQECSATCSAKWPQQHRTGLILTCFAFPGAAPSMTYLGTAAGASAAAEKSEAAPWPAESLCPGQPCAEASSGAPAICFICMVSWHLTCQRSHLHDMQAAATTEKPKARSNQYELQTLTTWLLKVRP